MSQPMFEWKNWFIPWFVLLVEALYVSFCIIWFCLKISLIIQLFSKGVVCAVVPLKDTRYQAGACKPQSIHIGSQ